MSRLPDLDGWAIFAKVAEKKSFSRAAAELGLSHTTVSKAIARLEDRLRTTLFRRTTRHLSLTESGRHAVATASRILDDGMAIEEDILEEAGTPRGLLRMAASVGFGAGPLAAKLPEFLHRFPEIKLDLRLIDAPVDLTTEGFDIVVRPGPVFDHSARITKLVSLRTPLVASPDYYKRYGRPAHPRELEHHEALVSTLVGGGGIWNFDHPKHGRHVVRISGRIQVNALLAVPLLVSGLAIAVHPEIFVRRELQDGKLEECLTEWASPPMLVNIVTPPGRAHPARVRVMLDFLRKLAAPSATFRDPQIRANSRK